MRVPQTGHPLLFVNEHFERECNAKVAVLCNFSTRDDMVRYSKL